MNSNLAIYTSHDASIAVRTDDNTYRVIELERLSGHRYYSLDNPPTGQDWLATYKQALALATQWQPTFTPTYLTIHPGSEVSTHPDWSPTTHLTPNFTLCGHHDAHAACAFYQSPYHNALILSYDGGGPDTDGQTQFFVIYRASRITGITRISSHPVNLGSAYLSHAKPVAEIHRYSKSSNWMSWAGKLMALAAYGQPDYAIVDLLFNGGHAETIFNERFKTRQFDWCATVQEYHQRATLRLLQPHLHLSLPICITGGCALNVKVNQHLRDLGYEVFVPPNPNDCGLTLGLLLWQDRPLHQVTCTFNGIDWPNDPRLSSYPTISLNDTVSRLAAGQIIGYIEGSSELGPRALGHRSILCRGNLPHARARLNAIKGREWYRPVSPVFISTAANHPSPFMSFAPILGNPRTDEWTHIDNTARFQTVDSTTTLGRLIDLTGYPLINTSLNLKGRPLVNTLDDALAILSTTALDCLVIQGHLIEK